MLWLSFNNSADARQCIFFLLETVLFAVLSSSPGHHLLPESAHFTRTGHVAALAQVSNLRTLQHSLSLSTAVTARYSCDILRLAMSCEVVRGVGEVRT